VPCKDDVSPKFENGFEIGDKKIFLGQVEKNIRNAGNFEFWSQKSFLFRKKSLHIA